ncbi:MAG: HNH endonuclease [Tenericutes bacterium]|nr:HNH endonuclease [Mycoplasmatota bacterium]
MTKPPPFKDTDKIKVLLWCERHCCICDKPCDTNIIIHHIEQESENLDDIRNAIPLCFDCHGKIKNYNTKHPWGTSYKVAEIKARRDQIYEKYTRHLVPPIHCEVTQIIRNNRNILRAFPNVGFNLDHNGIVFLPVKVRVETKIILRGKDKGPIDDKHGYYNGNSLWHLNPTTRIFGNFNLPEFCSQNNDDLKFEVKLTVVDQYEREHPHLPLCWTYVRKNNYWFLEPRSFAKWT